MAKCGMMEVKNCLRRDYYKTGDVKYIDVSYCKTLVPVVRKVEFLDILDTIGTRAITNRQKLLEQLEVFLKDTSYRAIILDISLDANTPTSADSELVSVLLQLPRIVIADTMKGCKLLDSRLNSIAGSTEYSINASEAGFVKYPLLKDDKRSLPLLLYEKLTDSRLKHLFGSVYFDGCSLACGNMFTTLNNRVEKMDTLRLGENELLPEDYKDNYIVIGAISEGDEHNSYIGDLSGPEININTYFALINGQHKISIITILLILGFYYLLSYSIVRSKWKITDRMQTSQLWTVRAGGFILSGLIYKILLIVPFVLNYLLFDQILTFTAVAFVFWVINKIVQTNKYIKK